MTGGGSGLGHDPDDIYAAYTDPGRDPWEALVVPVLKRIPARRLAEETGLTASTVKAARNGHAIPHERNRAALTAAASAFTRERLREHGVPSPADGLAACAAYVYREPPDP